MILCKLARPPRSGIMAVVHLVVCAIAVAGTTPLAEIGWGCRWLMLPDWQAVLAQLGFLLLAVTAVWQLVLALHDAVVRKVLWILVQVAAATIAVIFILYTGTGYAAALAGIGLLWLEVIRRTWPREAFRGPRLYAETFEPPKRAVRP